GGGVGLRLGVWFQATSGNTRMAAIGWLVASQRERLIKYFYRYLISAELGGARVLRYAETFFDRCRDIGPCNCNGLVCATSESTGERAT
ncbi:hypothetical protein, partial [Blastomonas sp. CCH4-D12]